MQKTATYWTVISVPLQLEDLHTVHFITVLFKGKLLSGSCPLNIDYLIDSALFTLSDPRSASYQAHLARKIH